VLKGQYIRLGTGQEEAQIFLTGDRSAGGMHMAGFERKGLLRTEVEVDEFELDAAVDGVSIVAKVEDDIDARAGGKG
jgi:hypothetical protein